jgi:hypothetical protein
MWGWATWRRVWKDYDISMKKWPKLRENNWLRQLFSQKSYLIYWESIFDSTYRGKVNTWDYQWVFSSWIKKYLNIVPRMNLVSNIGFSSTGTHLRERDNKYIGTRYKMTFPIKHPLRIGRNLSADNFEAACLYDHVGLVMYAKYAVKRLFVPVNKTGSRFI